MAQVGAVSSETLAALKRCSSGMVADALAMAGVARGSREGPDSICRVEVTFSGGKLSGGGHE
jgi:hypothetical protein